MKKQNSIKKNSICRTKPNVDIKEYKSSISKSDYYYISRKAREFILKNKICELPINLEELIVKNKWYLVSYNEIKQYGYLDDEIIKNDWGLSVFINNSYLILYDDTLSEGAKRFTIAHEIGHIFLNHFSGDVKSDSIETQASMFAARLLMPMCVLYECKIDTVEELENLCSVSKVAAQYRFERLQKLKIRNKFYTDKQERKVYKLFKGFIKKYNKKSKFKDFFSKIIGKFNKVK